MTAATDLLSPGGAGATFTGTRSAARLFWERFREDKAAMFAASVIIFLVLVAVFGGPLAAWVTGHPNTTAYNDRMLDPYGVPKGPNSQFWFGADAAGRDLFVRTMYGARTSLFVGVVASGIAVAIGLVVGLTAGFFGGWVDTALSRTGDVMLALPTLLISIGIVAACNSAPNGCLHGLVQQGLRVVIFVIAFFTWPYIARIVRGFTLSIREKEFVEAARALGASPVRQVVKHILPNALGPVIIAGTIDVAAAIIAESTLSFLGLGFPPDTPTWGRLLYDAKDFLDIGPHWALFPGGAIFIAVVAINFIGDGLRDALDARRVI